MLPVELMPNYSTSGKDSFPLNDVYILEMVSDLSMLAAASSKNQETLPDFGRTNAPGYSESGFYNITMSEYSSQ